MANWLQRVGRAVFDGARKYDSLDLFREIYGGSASSSGVNVTWQTALQVSTVLACVRVNANGVSQVPFRLYRTDADRRELAKEHDLYDVLYRRPNATQTSFEFRETLMFHLGLFWNAYVFVNRVGRERKIIELIPIEPQFVTVERVKGSSAADVRVTYKVQAPDGTHQQFPRESIWHIRGPSWNSYAGMDAVKLARNVIGLSSALENSHASLHKNGAQVGGLYSLENEVGAEKYEQLRAWLDKYEIGGELHGKAMILDRGAKFHQTVMNGVDSQHLETRKFQIEEICRIYGTMPIMVGYSDKAATYASAEQMFLAHVIHGLMPWYERIEQSADINLLSEADRSAGFYTKFTPNALLRGASKDRAEYFKAALGDTQRPGWLLRNEVRDLEEFNPIDGWSAPVPLVTDPTSPEDNPQ